MINKVNETIKADRKKRGTISMDFSPTTRLSVKEFLRKSTIKSLVKEEKDKKATIDHSLNHFVNNIEAFKPFLATVKTTIKKLVELPFTMEIYNSKRVSEFIFKFCRLNNFILKDFCFDRYEIKRGKAIIFINIIKDLDDKGKKTINIDYKVKTSCKGIDELITLFVEDLKILELSIKK